MTKKKSNAGAKPKIDKIVLQKLEEAFLLGATDNEACLYADIVPSTLYNYQKKYPRFLERKDLLKETPILKARTEVIKGFKGNPELALKFLERKRKGEFSLRTEVEHSGNILILDDED